jgi:hypothetical protein
VEKVKKSYFIVSGAIIVLLTCVKLNVLQALLLFFLVGAIPGTTVAVPSSIMLFLILAAAWLIIFRFTALKAFEKRALNHLVKTYQERKSNLPKRRFGQV